MVAIKINAAYKTANELIANVHWFAGDLAMAHA